MERHANVRNIKIGDYKVHVEVGNVGCNMSTVSFKANLNYQNAPEISPNQIFDRK